MTANEIKKALANKYSPPSYALFTEVAKGGVASFNGYIDAVAFALYPSLGHTIDGFEIKVSRQDFLREFEKPDKSGDAIVNCNRWWLVAPKGVCDKNELPKDWGFMEFIGGKFYKRKQAQMRDIEFNLSFIAGLLRRATEDTIPRSIYWDKVEDEKKEIRKEFAIEIEKTKTRLDDYVKKIREFEEASGLEILTSWTGGKEIGEAVRIVLGNRPGFDYEIQSFERELENLRKINEAIKIKSK